MENMVDVINVNNTTAVLCNFHYEQQTIFDGELWCDSVWDSVLCWPRTKASDTAKLQCPLAKGVDPTKKRCGADGKWEGRNGTQESPTGWTNYTPCYTSETLFLLRKIYTGNKDAAEVIMEIAENTRTLEFVGLSISVIALLISLAIFCRFRSLRNTRTRIHKNLFVAMAIQVTTRLILYIDQALMKSAPLGLDHGIHNTPILCKATYVLLEYARTAMFMWMFIEGFFLHNMVTVTVFQETTSYRMYRLIGWGLPVFMTMTWAIVTALYYPFTCFYNYNLTSYFWILEGPRMAVILLNFLFLMNIVRVLVVKLRQSHTSETEQIRKAVKATIVLFPLLGITNLLSMAGVPLEKTVWFALWSYTTHFLTSFQGLFLATIYCFLNGEVRTALHKTMFVYLSRRHTVDPRARRPSTFSACQSHRITSVIDTDDDDLRSCGWINLCCSSNRNTPSLDRPAETIV